MTKKDFVLIAAAVKRAADNPRTGTRQELYESVVEELTKALKTTSVAFNADAFQTACGLSPYEGRG